MDAVSLYFAFRIIRYRYFNFFKNDSVGRFHDRLIYKGKKQYLEEAIENVLKELAEVISKSGLRQLHTAETEKYAHVTFFLNGGIDEPYENETRVLIPSPDVKTYDEKPQMSANEVGEVVRQGSKG